MSENAVLPQTHLIRYVPKTQDISFVLPEMVAIVVDPTGQGSTDILGM